MKISVVIPTYNGRDTLVHLLPVLLQQDYSADDYEIIVVVDGSNDGTADYLRMLQAGPLLQIIEQANCGPAVARNRGVASASGELVLLLDDDKLIDTTLVRRHVQAHSGREPEVVFGPVPVAPESPGGLATDLLRISAERYVARLTLQGGAKSPFEVWVYSNCSMPRNLFLNSGGYDECAPFPGEDDDLAIRLWQAGAKFRFEPEIIAGHMYTKSAEDLVRDYGVRSAAAELYLCAKHPGYREHSPLGVWLKGPVAKRWVYWLVCCAAPNLSGGVLKTATRVLEAVRWIPLAKSLGVRVLGLRIGTARVTTAIATAGSPAKLRYALQL